MQLKYKDTAIELNTKEKHLMHLLVKNMPNVVESEIIMNYVWDDQSICDNTLRTQIKKIRLKLKDNFIKNIRNIGYKIIND